jgi:sugar diacid utilization regulator
MSWLKREGYWNSMRRSLEPVRIPAAPELDFAGRLTMRIAVDDEPLAAIWVADTIRSLDESDLDIIKEGANTAAHILLRQQAVLQKETELRVGFLEDMVQGRIASPENLRTVAHSLGWPIERLQQALVVTIDDFEDFVVRQAGRSSRRIQEVREKLTQVVRIEAQTLDAEAIVGPLSVGVVVLFGTDQPDATRRKGAAIRLADRIVRRVASTIPGMTVTVGIGNDFASFEHVAECFRQAHLAARLGTSIWTGNRAVHYDDLGIHRVLYAMREDEGAIPQSLQRIIDHDREHNTDFVPTVATYLGTRCRLRAAAEQLHIHRNTLQYRLRRIEELAGISFDDRDNRVALEIGLMVLEMRNGAAAVSRS